MNQKHKERTDAGEAAAAVKLKRDVARCRYCFDGGETGVGVPLSAEVISVYHADKPNEPVADITRCPKCSAVYTLRRRNAGHAHSIHPDAIRAVASKSFCISFKLSELLAGKLDPVIVPKHVQAEIDEAAKKTGINAATPALFGPDSAQWPF